MSDSINKKKPGPKEPDEISFQAKFSSTDCTGLIPSLPDSEEELESYNDIYQYLPPANEEAILMKRKREREQH